MAKTKPHSTELRHKVVQAYLAGETLHSLAHRYNLPRNLIRIWVDNHLVPTRDGEQLEGSLREDIAALAQTISECETRIETIERLVARRAAELEAQRQAPPQGREPHATSTSGVTSSRVPPPPGDSD